MVSMNRTHNYLNVLLLVASLFGYLQWGENEAAFLWKMELDVFSNLYAIANPLVFIPIAGQLFLLWSVFSKSPNKYPTYVGIGSIGLLFLFIFFAGIMAQKFWIVVSTLPFFALSILVIRSYQKL